MKDDIYKDLLPKEKTELSFWKPIAEKGIRGFSKEEYRMSAIKYKQYGLISIGRDISDLEGKIVVELCCGPSGIIVNTKAKKAVGIDPLYKVYSRLWDMSKDNVEYHSCAIEDFKADFKADVVICWNGIDHVGDVDKAISIIRDLLKDDGELWTFTNLEDRSLRLKYIRNKLADSAHAAKFNEASLSNFFYSNGFYWKNKGKFLPLFGKIYLIAGVGGVLAKGRKSKFRLLRPFIRSFYWRVTQTRLIHRLFPEG